MSAGWTDDTIARLRTLWDDGHSMTEIGRRMGIPKGAVAGKVHRLGLPPRPSPIIGGNDPESVSRREARAERAAQRELARAPKPPSIAPAEIAQIPPRPVRTGPGGECQWPTTVNGRHLMLCDAPCERGKPYCAGHQLEGTGRPQLSDRLQAKLAAAHAG